MPDGRRGARRRGWWLVALVLAAADVQAADAVARRPQLAREITLEGRGAGWVGVTLPKPVRFAATGEPHVVGVSNPAAFAGVLLVREQRGTWPPGVGVLSLPRGSGLPYAPVFFGHERGTSADDDHPMVYRRTLAAGSYRLYLLARGTAPLRVTVRFPVSGGRRSFRVPHNTTHHDAAKLAPGVPGAAVSPVHSHSATHPLDRRGLLLNVAWWSGDASVRYTVGGCAYNGPIPDPAPAAPTCPNGPGVMIDGSEVRAPDTRLSTGYLYVDRGRWLQKTYFAVGGVVRRGGIANLWVDLGAGYPPAG